MLTNQDEFTAKAFQATSYNVGEYQIDLKIVGPFATGKPAPIGEEAGIRSEIHWDPDELRVSDVYVRARRGMMQPR